MSNNIDNFGSETSHVLKKVKNRGIWRKLAKVIRTLDLTTKYVLETEVITKIKTKGNISYVLKIPSLVDKANIPTNLSSVSIHYGIPHCIKKMAVTCMVILVNQYVRLPSRYLMHIRPQNCTWFKPVEVFDNWLALEASRCNYLTNWVTHKYVPSRTCLYRQLRLTAQLASLQMPSSVPVSTHPSSPFRKSWHWQNIHPRMVWPPPKTYILYSNTRWRRPYRCDVVTA